MPSSSEIVETLISATDRIKLLVGELEANQSEESGVDDLVAQLTLWIDGESAVGESFEQPEPPAAAEEGVVASTSPYASEEDRELYAIFEAHLQEQYAELASLLSQITSGGDTASLLEQSIDVLEQMRSSANYMDYVELVQRYQIWKNDLETALLHSRSAEPVRLDSLSENMRELSALFPVLNSVAIPDVSGIAISPSVEEEQPDVSDAVARAFAEMSGAGAAVDTTPASSDEPAGDIELSLLPDFVVETDEHLDEMEGLLLQLMQQPDDRGILNDIFRPIHSIKGSAQYIGLTRVSRLAHVLEDLLDLLREGKVESNFDIVETLIAARDRILRLNDELKQSQQE
jgi:two-component system chemotaxis sensor kinase CheA